jgi:hypothetical protein
MGNLFAQGSNVGSSVIVYERGIQILRHSPPHYRVSLISLPGVYFAPESGSDMDDANGKLTLGGADPTKETGTLNYFARSAAYPYSRYVLLFSRHSILTA